MINTFEQRWSAGRHVFLPPADRFDPSVCDVAVISSDEEARAFVQREHYSHSYPAARRRFGLYLRGSLVGVAVFSHPCSDAVLTSVFPGQPTDSMELGRFVLLPVARFNAETWFLGRTFELLRREGFRGIVSRSDPEPRTNGVGDVIFPGHIGTIYQAHNAVYLGRAPTRTIRLLPDGTVMSARAIQKIRSGDQGHRYAIDLLVAAGATPPSGDVREWLRQELPKVTRTLRHNGNHKYAWALARRGKRALPQSQPYPRRVA